MLYKEVFPPSQCSEKWLNVINCDVAAKERCRGVSHSSGGIYVNSIQGIEGRPFLDVAVDAPFSEVYFHWIFDVIPQIYLAIESPIKFDAIWVPRIEAAFQYQTLEYFKLLPLTKTYADASRLDLRVARTSRCLEESLEVPTWAIECLRKGALGAELVKDECPKRIFVSRRKARNRRIVNENEVAEALGFFGFECVVAEDLDFQKQLQLFAQADFVVAPHGSGLTNIVFLKPGSRVIEIFGPRNEERCYGKISQLLNLQYLGLSFDCKKHSHLSISDQLLCDSNEEGKALWDFHVPIDKLISAVEVVLNS